MWRKKNFYDQFQSEEERIKYLSQLRDNVENGNRLTIDERNDFCHALWEELKETYPICEEVIFRSIYLKYANEESLSSKELGILEKNFNEWSTIISKTNHSNELFQYIAKEARDEIKNYDQSQLFGSSLMYKKGKKRIVLRSRYVKLVVELVFDRIGKEYIELNLNKFIIHIDQYSMVHIMNRHYAQSQKSHLQGKSFFTPEINTYDIISTLESIIHAIETSSLFQGEPDKMTIRYKGRYYHLYFKKVVKSEKGRGNYRVARVNTFYPVEDESGLVLIRRMTSHTINQNLSLMV